MLGLFALTVSIIPVALYMSGACDTPEIAVTEEKSSVVAAVSIDTLSAVSGIDKVLNIELVNQGGRSFEDGVVLITVFREQRDSSSAVTSVPSARYVAKNGIDLAPQSTQNLTYIWSIPSTLPTAVYRIDAQFFHNAVLYEDSAVRTSDPFGNSAKMYISGDADASAIFTPIGFGDLGLAVTNGSNPCPYTGNMYIWVTLTGVMGLIMFSVSRWVHGRN